MTKKPIFQKYFGWMEGCNNGGTEEWRNGWMEGWMDEWMDGRKEGWTNIVSVVACVRLKTA